MKKKKKKVLKSKLRIFFSLIIFGSFSIALGYNCFSNISKINELKQEKAVLEDKIVSLKEEKEILENDISNLEDPDYIAKYVREKYFYSKEGELILRIDN